MAKDHKDHKDHKDDRDQANGAGRKRKRETARAPVASDQNQMIAAVGAVALVLGAGLGVLLFGASRKRAGAALPGNMALGGDATGGLANDGPIEGATQADDWFAMREGAGGADSVTSPAPSGAGMGGEGEGEHVPTDLTPGARRPERAVEAFRPDRDARVLPAERDAFAPATMPVPSRVEAMGNGDDD